MTKQINAKTAISRILGLKEELILETPLGKSSQFTSMYSCTLSMEQYLELVPLEKVKDHVENEGQRNHVDRSATAQADHVKLDNPPPQQACIDMVLHVEPGQGYGKGRLVNLDAYHRTLSWHIKGAPFDNIRLTVFIEQPGDGIRTGWGMLDMYDVYDSPKAVRTNNHKLSSAYRIAGFLRDLQSKKIRTGGCWSAIRRVLGVSGTKLPLKTLAVSAEAQADTIRFLDELQCMANDRLENIELVAFGLAYREANAYQRMAISVIAAELCIFLREASPLSKMPAPLAELYGKGDVPQPHHGKVKRLEQHSYLPLSSSGSRSGEAVIDVYADKLKTAISAAVIAELTGKRKAA